MPTTSSRFGLVVMPADVELCRSSQPHSLRKVTIDALRFPDESVANQLLPLFVLKEADVPRMLVEINRFSQPFGSWVIVPEDEKVVPEICSNGNMTFVTRIDPLFPALVLMDGLRKVTGNDVFQPLEALCRTEDGTNLAKLCEEDQFGLICDMKEAAGEKYYRLNDEKVTDWLIQKHNNLMKQPQIDSESATAIISQYLSDKWKQVLLKSHHMSCETDNRETPGSQNGEALAMAIMMEDARETNRAKRRLQHATNGSSFTSKPSGRNIAKKKRTAGTATNFWSSLKSANTS